MLIIDSKKWEFLLELPQLYSMENTYQDDCFGNPYLSGRLDFSDNFVNIDVEFIEWKCDMIYGEYH